MAIRPRSTKAWTRIEGPLRALDDELEAYAERHGLRLSRNFREWPERSLRWQDDLERPIQIMLPDGTNLLFGVWLAAWRDEGEVRHWKRASLAAGKTIGQIEERLPALLDEAKQTVCAWTADDLVPRGSNVR